jgi:threonine dehydratase
VIVQRSVQAPERSDIAEARDRLTPFLVPTPVVASPALASNAWLKLETFQPTGSFKVRGAFAALTRLEPGESVVTASTGNHALAVAYAAAALGLRTTVVCAESTSPAKLEALRRIPVELVVHGANVDEAEAYALSLAGGKRRFVSAYNDREVIAGQGTVAVELMEQLRPPLTIVCPVGGGGLIAGISLWASGVSGWRAVGVQAEAQQAMRAALEAGRIVRVDDRPTLADGLAGNLEPGSVTVDLVARTVEDVLLVSEDEIASAMRFLAGEHGLVVEGAGATAVAAVLAGRLDAGAGATVALVTGRNIELAALAPILAAS